ncbi:GTP cyclohydrolase II [Rhodococcoides fascians]|uniref:GTP cyclohydrolase II n=1 Tax=Rhodococcoides fascians TaxID=1828 RepID=UPI001D21C391|nr:GTP cyclohydrolase II [Rhodococcus fascians]CAH0310210.1 Riboflavin biosynthesis protein RibBA [Rhodococcus fascians]
MTPLAPLTDAVAAIARGRMVLVADDADRENEGDLIMAAEFVDAEHMAFLLRHGSGIVCTPMSGEIADRLELPPMVQTNTDNHQTAFTVAVDAADAGTGISASDRAHTVRVLGQPQTRPDELRRPGHLFPLRARAGGVLERPGHTEASIELLRMAGLYEVAVITELVSDDGVPMSGRTLNDFAAEHDIPMITVADLVAFRKTAEISPVLGESALLPTDYGVFEARTYTAQEGGAEHLVLTHGDVRAASLEDQGVLVRVHSECVTGDVVKSRRCDCGTQLDSALRAIADEGAGVLVYLRGHEGRGIGLSHKLAAYKLQESGLDTVDANVSLGLPIDSRDYSISAAVLTALGVGRIRLITNNPHKIDSLTAGGVAVTERVHTPTSVNADNLTYLRTKRDRMGHLLDLPVALP